MITKELKHVYTMTLLQDGKVLWVGVAYKLKLVHEVSKFRGQLATPSISYKTLVRRLKEAKQVYMYDRNRFGTEDEAKFRPDGSIVRIEKVEFFR